ncbi:DUF362 domain-containing protein [Bacteroidota bacterium]
MKFHSRRSFIKSSATVSAAAFFSSFLIPKFLKANFLGTPDIVSIPGNNPKVDIPRLLESLGGIEKFIKKGDSVGFLINSPWVHPGYYTNPDVVLIMMEMCKKAGADELICFKPAREGYWESSQYYEEMKDLIDEITYSEDRIEVDIPNGFELKSAVVYKDLKDVDVFINIPVAKHHNGTLFSGILKNLMGASDRETNRYMHSPSDEYTYGKQEYLSTCIADLNLIRLPDLSIIDAIECGLENGPRGPGNTTQPNKILAGTKALTLDMYSAKLIGIDPDDIVMFKKAADHKIGDYGIDDNKILILE